MSVLHLSSLYWENTSKAVAVPLFMLPTFFWKPPVFVNYNFGKQRRWRLILAAQQMWLLFLLASLPFLSKERCWLQAPWGKRPTFLLLSVLRCPFTAVITTEVPQEFFGLHWVLSVKGSVAASVLPPRGAFLPSPQMPATWWLIVSVRRTAEWLAGFQKWTPVSQRQGGVTT